MARIDHTQNGESEFCQCSDYMYDVSTHICNTIEQTLLYNANKQPCQRCKSTDKLLGVHKCANYVCKRVDTKVESCKFQLSDDHIAKTGCRFLGQDYGLYFYEIDEYFVSDIVSFRCMRCDEAFRFYLLQEIMQQKKRVQEINVQDNVQDNVQYNVQAITDSLNANINESVETFECDAKKYIDNVFDKYETCLIPYKTQNLRVMNIT
tara:strand:- start:277 stop:897 length:621 start_codon:yes stop_codon:yes gene_type:complete